MIHNHVQSATAFSYVVNEVLSGEWMGIADGNGLHEVDRLRQHTLSLFCRATSIRVLTQYLRCSTTVYLRVVRWSTISAIMLVMKVVLPEMTRRGPTYTSTS